MRLMARDVHPLQVLDLEKKFGLNHPQAKATRRTRSLDRPRCKDSASRSTRSRHCLSGRSGELLREFSGNSDFGDVSEVEYRFVVDGVNEHD